VARRSAPRPRSVDDGTEAGDPTVRDEPRRGVEVNRGTVGVREDRRVVRGAVGQSAERSFHGDCV